MHYTIVVAGSRDHMDTNRLLDMAAFAGKLLIESGAEIYRVEETMVRLCTCFHEVEDAQSFVTPTGIMFSITVDQQTLTKVLRVKSRGTDLNCIDKINDLSRRATQHSYSIDEIWKELQDITNEKRYGFWTTLFFGALSALGFAIFFHGTWKEAIVSFIIGMLIKTVSFLLEKREWNVFFTNALSAGLAAIAALGFQYMDQGIHSDIVIISSIMLLVPGLAITNAVRDTMAGDYLSGVSRATEAFLIAVAIAVGIGLVLSMSIRFKGGL